MNHYLLHQIKASKWSEATQHIFINTLVFYFEKVARTKVDLSNLRPRKPKRLPNVLTENEVVELLKATDNLKHKTILMLIYSAGLRLGELLSLRKDDLHKDRNRIYTKAGKGKKDRYSILSHKMMAQIQLYLKEHQPLHWLFEGPMSEPYSARSVQAILRKAVEKAKVNPFATVHTLRHSFDTHLLENRTDLLYLEELLGHSDVKTTLRYTHVSNKSLLQVESPLDRALRKSEAKKGEEKLD